MMAAVSTKTPRTELRYLANLLRGRSLAADAHLATLLAAGKDTHNGLYQSVRSAAGAALADPECTLDGEDLDQVREFVAAHPRRRAHEAPLDDVVTIRLDSPTLRRLDRRVAERDRGEWIRTAIREKLEREADDDEAPE